MSAASFAQDSAEETEERTPDSIFLAQLDGWEQVVSLYRGPRGVLHKETMLGEPPNLESDEVELVRILTNGCGSNAAVLVGKPGNEDRFIGKWNGTVLDDHPDQESLFEQGFNSWVGTLKFMLSTRND